MEMTGPEIDKRIALALGYKVTPNNIWSRPPDKHGTVMSGSMALIVPKFHKDLNATYEARQGFSQHELDAYRSFLTKLGGTLLGATPRDHAEAWLRAKKAWPKAPTAVAA
jgi:hypothetical protein